MTQSTTQGNFICCSNLLDLRDNNFIEIYWEMPQNAEVYNSGLEIYRYIGEPFISIDINNTNFLSGARLIYEVGQNFSHPISGIPLETVSVTGYFPSTFMQTICAPISSFNFFIDDFNLLNMDNFNISLFQNLSNSKNRTIIKDIKNTNRALYYILYIHTRNT